MFRYVICFNCVQIYVSYLLLGLLILDYYYYLSIVKGAIDNLMFIYELYTERSILCLIRSHLKRKRQSELIVKGDCGYTITLVSKD